MRMPKYREFRVILANVHIEVWRDGQTQWLSDWPAAVKAWVAIRN